MLDKCIKQIVTLPFTGKKIEINKSDTGYVHLEEVAQKIGVNRRTMTLHAKKLKMPMLRMRVGNQFAWAVSLEDADKLIEQWLRTHV